MKIKKIKDKECVKSTRTRHIEFLHLFRKFDSTHECCEWITKAIGVKNITIMVWRCKVGTIIPQKKWDAIKVYENKHPISMR